jgi:polysaccharide pyruvyl transferase WcaK-like protein
MYFMAEHSPFQVEYEKFMAQLILALKNNPIFSIELFTTGEEGDSKLVEIFAKKYHLPFTHPQSLNKLNQFYQTVDIVVATRLHSAILAMTAGKYVIGIGIQGKMRGFFKLLSLADYCLTTLNSDNLNKLVALLSDTHQMEAQIDILNVNELLKEKEHLIREVKNQIFVNNVPLEEQHSPIADYVLDHE